MSMLNSVKNGLLRIFGDIKVFKWPMFILYDPGSYKVKGEDMRAVIELIQPGDMLVRGYDNYLDGYFIPGYFSHAGLYLGKVTADDRKLITSPEGAKRFKTGSQMVIHSMAEGVFMEDILNFCRCDTMAIVRFPERFAAPAPLPETVVAFDQFTAKEKELFARLNRGETIQYSEAFSTVFELALQQLGKGYDYDFDFRKYNNLSCTEFVYFCIKSLQGFHRLRPEQEKVFMFSKQIITPDAFLRSGFRKVWQSRSVTERAGIADLAAGDVIK
jgi:hypothetical protein